MYLPITMAMAVVLALLARLLVAQLGDLSTVKQLSDLLDNTHQPQFDGYQLELHRKTSIW